MMCLNPVIAFMNKSRTDGKATLSNFRNFKEYIKDFGDDYILDLLKQGKTSEAFAQGYSYIKKDFDVVLLPCRKCVNCQLNRSREWAIRNTLEAREYDDNSKLFITLTYNDTSLLRPSNRYEILTKKNKVISLPKLNVRDVQGFLKRLRRKFEDYKIRFYLCGEYGGRTGRPHYHILLYGLPINAINDLDLLYETKNGKFYNSKTIEDIWSYGFVNISNFSDFTAMYTARYCTKKQAQNFSQNYAFLNEFKKEFNTMSRKPGIAHNYIINHKDDIYKYDEFIFHIDEKTLILKPITYFDRVYDYENPTQMAFIKENRKQFANQYDYFMTLENNYGINEYLSNCEESKSRNLNIRSN